MDVIAHKRAVSRIGLWHWQEFDDDYNMRFSQAVAEFQRSKGIEATGFWGRPTQNAVANLKAVDHPGEWAYDATALELLEREKALRTKSPEQQKAEALYAYCGHFDDGYCYGGEHDGNVLDDSPHACFDCSSSVSAALAHVGLLGSGVAHVSGWFKSWGSPNRGRFVTVHAASDHVWMEFTIPGKQWARFDTSPHGDGPTGARMRHKQRSDDRFVHRHPSGL